jgi:hypothetical protein
MNRPGRTQQCHPERVSRSPERSEGEGSAKRVVADGEILRCAQDDMKELILMVTIHHRAATHLYRSLLH